MFLPARSSAAVRERMAHLDRAAAKFQLYELDEHEEALQEIDCADRGNIATRLVYCPAESSARERFAVSIAKIVAMVPEAEVAVLSAGEIAFRLRGLEFARARLAARAASFRHSEEIIFGAGQMSACLASTMPMHS